MHVVYAVMESDANHHVCAEVIDGPEQYLAWCRVGTCPWRETADTFSQSIALLERHLFENH